MKEQDAFWMVWCPLGGPPAARHTSHSLAVNEAERLARKCSGREFFVLRATDLRVVNDMQRVQLVADIPF